MRFYFLFTCTFLLLFTKPLFCHSSELVKPQIVRLLRPVQTHQPSELEGIDCIYVINLEERPERWEKMQRQFKEKGIQGNRLRAVNGWMLPKETLKALLAPGSTLSPGGVGCLLSHLSIYQDALERNFETIWILEDDVEFLEDPRLVPQLVKQLYTIDPDWDIFYTDTDSHNLEGEYNYATQVFPRDGQQIPPLEHFLERKQVSPQIMHLRLRSGTHSVVLSRQGLLKLYRHFSENSMWTHIDNDLHLIPNIEQYALTRDLTSTCMGPQYSDTGCNTTYRMHRKRKRLIVKSLVASFCALSIAGGWVWRRRRALARKANF